MTIEKGGRSVGVDVHLEPDECALLVQLARDAAEATFNDWTPTYVSVCVKLGQRIDAVLNPSSDQLGQ
jgi:hypothetical protein